MKSALHLFTYIFRLFLIVVLGVLMMRATYGFQADGEAVSANTPPSIAAVAPLPIRAGGKKTGLVIASVKDRESLLGELKVTATPVPGFSFTNIKNTDGIITADIEVDCSILPVEKTIRLTVSDGLLTGNTFLTIIVSDLASVNLGRYNNATTKGITPFLITPTGLSIDPESNVTLSVEAQQIPAASIEQTTGAISFPAGINTGSYLVVIRATNNCGILASRSFTLSVTNPPACNAMTFSTPAASATSETPTAMAAGDFNGDEKPDIVIANYELHSISVFLNDGTGQWITKKDYAVGKNPKFVAVSDLNDDGVNDLVVANSSDGTLSILAGSGDGTFTAKPVITGMDYPSSVAFGDFNKDRKKDLVITNSGAYVTTVIYGNGDGTFGTGVSYYQGRLPVSVVAGDFDKDGLDDFAVANTVSGTVTVFRNFGADYFSPVNIEVGNAPSAIVAGDFNADGWLDLVVANYETNAVLALNNNHAGGFQPPIAFPVAANPLALATADFNNDGSEDLAVLSPTANSLTLYYSEINNSVISFVRPLIISTNEAYAIALADFNTDGQLDFSLSSYWTNELISSIGTCIEAPTNAAFRTVIYRQREKTARTKATARFTQR